MRQSKSANFKCEETQLHPVESNLAAKKSKLHLLMSSKGDSIGSPSTINKPHTASTPITEEIPLYTPKTDYYKTAYNMIPAGGQFSIIQTKSKSCKLDYSI